MRPWMRGSAGFVCLLMVACTALPLIETDEWWIRILDFPRIQIAAVLLVALSAYVALSFPLHRRGWRFGSVAALSLAAIGWQVALILPYTPLSRVEMIAGGACEPERRVRFLMANVLQHNRDAPALLALVRQSDPDLILVTEVDRWWLEQLAALARTHPATLLQPLDNTYGIGLYSRLPLREQQLRYLVEADIPSIRTVVTLRDGTDFVLWGVHPAPPRPANDTDERDAELLIVAKEAADAQRPAVVAGDLNDVAWSATTTLFQKISGLLDPRIGRGLYSTFNANWPLLRWPLDHLFASPHWVLTDFRRLGHIGSDHYPMLVELCHRPQAKAVQQGAQPDGEDLEDARESIQKGREAAGED